MPKMYPDDKTLEKFALGKLARRENLKVAWHLYNSAASRRKLQDMFPDKGEGLLQELFAGLEPTDAVAENTFDNAFARSRSAIEVFTEAKDRDRSRAPRLFAELMRHPVSRQRKLIERTWRFKNYVFGEFLLEKSREQCTNDPARAEDLGELALTVAAQLENSHYGPALINDLKAKAWIQIANARRAGSDLRSAEEALQTAEPLRAEGSQDPMLRALHLGIEAALRRGQNRYDEALALDEQALGVYTEAQDSHMIGVALVSKGNTLEGQGHHDEAVSLYQEALDSLDSERDPRLQYATLANLCNALAESGRAQEAADLLPQALELSREHGNQLDTARVLWIQGRLALDLGNQDEAEASFRQARELFLEASDGLDAAAVSLDLSAHLVDTGRTAEVKELVQEMLPIFRSRDVHKEVNAALLVFKKAVETEQVTLQLVHEVSSFLRQARTNPGLKFQPAS